MIRTAPDELYLKSPEKPLKLNKNNRSIAAILEYNKNHFPSYRCFGTREFLPSSKSENVRGLYEWYTYEQVYDMVACFARGLQERGFKKGDKLLMMSPNRTEWQICDAAMNSIGVIIVPIYDSQGKDEIVHVANHSDSVGIIISADRLPVFSPLMDRMPNIKHVILLDDRWDDRAWLIAQSEALPFPLPNYTRNAPHTESFMDDLDTHNNIANPAPRPKGMITENAPRAQRIMAHKYIYNPPEYVLPGIPLDSGIVKKITDTFHTISLAGEESFKGNAPRIETGLVGLDDVAILQYTSGTTSLPKGAVLTNHGVICGIHCYANRPPPQYWDPHNPQIVMMSYLPNAHIFQHVISWTVVMIVGATGFWQGGTALLMDDVKQLRPTFFPAVPRILQRLVDTIMRNVMGLSPLKRFMFFSVYDSVRRHIAQHKPLPGPLKVLSGKIFGTIRQLMGGRCDFIASGSAPLSPKTAEFVASTLGCTMIEGYGASETCAITACQVWDDSDHGTSGGVGIVMRTMELKLKSVPELDYSIDDGITGKSPVQPVSPKKIALPPKEPGAEDVDRSGSDAEMQSYIGARGEIYVRGPAVFREYYKDPVQTAEVKDEEGWFKTGDIGLLVPGQQRALGIDFAPRICVIDRAKNIFKLSQGEYVSATNVEAAINSSTLVKQSVIFGNSFESYLLCVVNIEEKDVRTIMKEEQSVDLSEISLNDLCRDARVIRRVHEDIITKCREEHLLPYEIPKAIIIDPIVWDAENDLATPSMKLKTAKIKAIHKERFMDLYARINREGFSKVNPAVAADIVVASHLEGPCSDVGSDTSFSRMTVFK